ncbi:MAG TPA: DUF5655 domain-containing protein [Ignavibacteria bacterium]|nr:DUF5655 domain-containing protein [Ignavibacteria bacterium]
MDTDKATQTMIENLKKNTGKTLEDWITLVKKSGKEKHSEIVKYLKEEHKFTHGFANLVALKTRGTDAVSVSETEDLVEKQYKGKENLKPIYEKLVKEIMKLGKDIEISPKNAYVSIRRKKQFALIQPTTKTRADLGINLKGKAPEGKLEASGSFNAMVSHRVKLEKAEDIDSKVIEWMKAAYDMAG